MKTILNTGVLALYTIHNGCVYSDNVMKSGYIPIFTRNGVVVLNGINLTQIQRKRDRIPIIATYGICGSKEQIKKGKTTNKSSGKRTQQ